MNYEALTPEVQGKLKSIIAALPEGSVIAGGYIRDLLLGLPVRDMDILVPSDPTPFQLAAVQDILDVELVVFDPTSLHAEDYEAEVGRTSDIQKVYKDFFHEKVDILVVDNVNTHFNEFPDNLSKVRYTHEGLELTPEFILGHSEKTIRYRNGAPEARITKLMLKFPDYKVVIG